MNDCFHFSFECWDDWAMADVNNAIARRHERGLELAEWDLPTMRLVFVVPCDCDEPCDEPDDDDVSNVTPAPPEDRAPSYPVFGQYRDMRND